MESVGIFILIAFGLTFIKNVFVKFNFGEFIFCEGSAEVTNYLRFWKTLLCYVPFVTSIAIFDDNIS